MSGPADSIACEMTGSLEQLASLTSGSSTWTTTGIPGVLPQLVLSDGPHGLRFAGAHSPGLARSVPATCFPPAVSLGCSWNPELAAEVGAAIGREARTLGVNVVLGPGLNIKRSPLGGRNFEYFSEDPCLTGGIGAGLVRGIQSQGVGATVKHFAANNQETDRMRVSAEVDERALHEIYLAAFEHVIREARPFALMAADNKINGVHASQNRWLLTTVLRETWGYDGLVMSDWGAVSDRVAALSAGLDLEMPPTRTDDLIVAAVRRGELDPAVLDAACARLAALARRTTGRREPVAADLRAHDDLARRAASESIVLLRNDGVLPLDPSARRRVAVIGEFARTPRIQGGGSSRVNPAQLHTALDGLTSALTDSGRPGSLEFAPGYLLSGEPAPALCAAAIELAQRSDVVLLFLGLPDAAESEGADRPHLSLPAAQAELLHRLADTRVPIVVVLSNGSPVDVASWHDAAAAVVEAWLPGQAGGAAIADILTGRVSPSGRLTETIPVRLEDTPCYLHFPGRNGVSVYGESVYVGYRYYDTLGVPVAYPFGFGLSYSTFEYSNLVVTPAGANSWTVQLTVTNAGSRPAADVPQLYVAVDEPRPTRPVHELRAFTKVFLDAGEATTVTLALTERDFATWDVAEHRWSVEPGRYIIQVGASSRDIRLQAVVTSPGDGHRRELSASATVGEWLADRAGEAILAPYLERMPAAWFEHAPELRRMIAQLPVSRLCTLSLGLGAEQLARMAAEANRRPAQ
jgi:beta-glucosidase